MNMRIKIIILTFVLLTSGINISNADEARSGFNFYTGMFDFSDDKKSSQLFDPYTTTKDHGTGLGLTIVSQTVTDHQGFVRFSSGEGGGAVFTIELPVM